MRGGQNTVSLPQKYWNRRIDFHGDIGILKEKEWKFL